MAPPSVTAILIVHGGYFLPSSWDDFITHLTQKGFTVECPHLPSCGDTQPPTATLADDVSAVRAAAQKLRAAGHTIAVLAHSYGGVVASEAITPELYASEDPTGKGIACLVLLSAWLVQSGDSLPGVIEKYGFQCKVDLGNHGDGTVFAKNAPESFYNDIERARGEELARANVTHNWAAAAGGVTAAPWMDLPTVYVHSTRDLAIMLPLQESMVLDAVNAGGRVRTETLEAGHCAFLSRPDELVGVLQRAIDGL
ncbi:alpha/beta-hydrolase [Aspergillus varians]